MNRLELRNLINLYLSTLDDENRTDSGGTERTDAEHALNAFLEWHFPAATIKLPVTVNGNQVIDGAGAVFATCAGYDDAALLADTLNRVQP